MGDGSRLLDECSPSPRPKDQGPGLDAAGPRILRLVGAHPAQSRHVDGGRTGNAGERENGAAPGDEGAVGFLAPAENGSDLLARSMQF